MSSAKCEEYLLIPIRRSVALEWHPERRNRFDVDGIGHLTEQKYTAFFYVINKIDQNPPTPISTRIFS